MSDRPLDRPSQLNPPPEIGLATPPTSLGAPKTLGKSINYDDGVRLQALALVEFGIAPKEVEAITGIHRSTISRLRKKARQRGYDPGVSKALKLEYVTDAPRSGRPPEVTEEGDLVRRKKPGKKIGKKTA